MALLRSGFNSVAGFLAWWRQELLACIPAPLRRLIRQQGPRLVAEVDGDETVIYAVGRGSWTEIGSVEIKQGVGETLYGQIAKSRIGKAKNATLLLPSENVVSRTVDLPLAAEENLREVIEFQIGRLTPFSADDVYFDYHVARRDTTLGSISAKLSLAPRAPIDRQVGALAQAGVVVNSVDVGSAKRGVMRGLNLLPRTDRKPKGMFDHALTGMAVAAVFVAGVSAIAIPLERKARLDDRVYQQMLEAKARAKHSQQLKDEVARLQQSGTYLIDLKQKFGLVIEVLDAATALLPDKTWLGQLRLANDRLVLDGFSPDSSQLIGIFESSPIFSDVKFAAPVTQDPVQKVERFNLSMRVEGPVTR